MIIDKPELLDSITNNYFQGKKPNLKNSKIIIDGENNFLICEDNVVLVDTTIHFYGNNNIVYLSSSKEYYKLDLSLYNNSTAFIGKNNYFNGIMHIILSEQTNFILGDNGVHSFGIWVRTADPHLIYDISSKKRINMSKSIFIGDHVWLGQSCMILKGTKIDSGSIIGGMSVVSNKTIGNNESWAGNPAKRVRENIFWNGTCVHRWLNEDTQKSFDYNDFVNDDKVDEYIYNYDKINTIKYEEIDKKLYSYDVKRKVIYITKIAHSSDKNRFVHNIHNCD